MPPRRRLDAELVRRGLARSREQAVALIADGRVTVSGRAASKPATGVAPAEPIVVSAGDMSPYVSRGAHKLAGALDVFEPAGLAVVGRRCLDAGASTGGFTEVLLRRGAAQVVAVDVGYGQLAWALRTDPRVVVMDRTNVRELSPDVVGDPVELVVADLSFISLRLVLEPLLSCTASDGDLVLMVKPQFEVGRGSSVRAGSSGIRHCVPGPSARSRRRPATSAWAWRASRRARCRARRETSSTSSGFVRERRRWILP